MYPDKEKKEKRKKREGEKAKSKSQDFGCHETLPQKGSVV